MTQRKTRTATCRHPNCGILFTASAPNSKYCGAHRGGDAFAERLAAQGRVHEPVRSPRKCRRCDMPFLTKPGQRYCSEMCRKLDENDRRRVMELPRKYGITDEQYHAMLREQVGKCAVCGRRGDKRLSIDHDHTTGKVRGLLCNRCNLDVGTIERLRRDGLLEAITEYIEKSRKIFPQNLV